MTPAPRGLDEVRRFFGDVKIRRVGGAWKIVEPSGWEGRNCVVETFDELGGRRLYVHRAIVEPMHAALALAAQRAPDYLVKTIGCFNPRPQRGVSDPGVEVGWEDGLSVHTVAAALDINADDNPRGVPMVCDMPDGFISAWEDTGWRWGGRFKISDPQHFQYAFGV